MQVHKVKLNWYFIIWHGQDNFRAHNSQRHLSSIQFRFRAFSISGPIALLAKKCAVWPAKRRIKLPFVLPPLPQSESTDLCCCCHWKSREEAKNVAFEIVMPSAFALKCILLLYELHFFTILNLISFIVICSSEGIDIELSARVILI